MTTLDYAQSIVNGLQAVCLFLLLLALLYRKAISSRISK